MLSAIFYPFTASAQDGSFSIHFIDVGEGDCILIKTSTNRCSLIDAGNLKSGHLLSGYLESLNISAIDYFIVTHPHPDHFSGAFFILPQFNTKNILTNGQDFSGLIASSDLYRWYNDLLSSSKKITEVRKGESFILDDLKFRVLWPAEPDKGSYNDNSMVLMLEYKNFKCLLMADATHVADSSILGNKKNYDVDILKVAHHGHTDGTSLEFLESISPEYSVITVDRKNRNGYPSKEVVGRLLKNGSKVLRTDQNGTIVFNIGKNGEIVNIKKEIS